MSESTALPLRERIDADLQKAMREQDNLTKLVLRSVKTALTLDQKAGADHSQSEEQVIAILQREVKRRRETAAEFEKLGSPERAAQELAEVAVLERYLPRPLDEAEVEAMAAQAIAETGATSPREMGKVMSVLMPRLGGRADGKVASQIVRRLLGG